MAGSPLVAGIDIGGTKISASLIDDDGTIIARDQAPTPAHEGGDAIAATATALVCGLQALTNRKIHAAGVGAAGVIDQRAGTVVAAADTFARWAGYPIGPALARTLGIPVTVENDVNAFLVGELSWGAATQTSDALGIMIGTGVGGAIVMDGVLRHGKLGAAGEIGHIPRYSNHLCTCGQVGHLETLASGRGIGLRYGERSGVTGLSAAEVADLARAGDADAIAVYAGAGDGLALAILATAGLLDLDQVVIGGGVSSAWDLLWPALHSRLEAEPPVSGATVHVQPSRLGHDAVAAGAAALARKNEKS